MKLNHFNNFIILVTGILRNQRGDVLLLKRSKNNKTFKGFWQLPEGKMEFGEQPEETITREIEEELGYKILSVKSKTVKSVVIKFGQNLFHLLRIVFEVKCKGESKLSIEHDDFQWISIKKAINLPNLVDGIKEILLGLK